MSYHEKRAIVSLITTLLSSSFYFAYVLQRHGEETLRGQAEFSFWAAAILLFIPFQVVLKIIIHIIFSIINTVTTNETEPDLTDERDWMIDLKATRNFYHVFMAGFLLAMGALVADMSPTVMFKVIISFMLAAGVVLDASQLYFYWKGV